MTPAAPRHRLRRLREAWHELPHSLAIAAGVLPLLLVLWAPLCVNLYRREAQLQNDNETRIYNFAQVSAQTLYGMFLAADQTLLDLLEARARDPNRFNDTVQRRQRAAALGIDFSISPDVHGIVSYSSLNSRAVGMLGGNALQ